MRAIDGEKLYNERPEYLNERHVTNGEFNRGWNACNKMWSETVREQPTIEMQRWIPVTERLPEVSEKVIVCRKGGKVEQGMFLGVNGWWKVYGTNTKAVTHWMPLPDAPKDGE